MPAKRHEVQIDRHRLSVSNLDKPLFPAGFTKGALIEYYVQIAPWMLPHLKNRPVTFKRYPEGVGAKPFFEKNCNAYRPPWVGTASIHYKPGSESVEHCLLHSRADLAWAANLAAIEIHVSLATAKKIHSPTMVVFDLDPGPGRDILDCCRVALMIRDLLEQVDLQCLIKSSGGKGLHLYIPMNTPTSYEQTQPFAKALAALLAHEHPDEITAVMAKSQRKRKIYVDWAQNMLHKTTVCAYSVRAREQPTVSAPLSFDEIERAISRRSAKGLVFEADAMLRRVEKVGDLFEPALKLKQRLPDIGQVAGRAHNERRKAG